MTCLRRHCRGIQDQTGRPFFTVVLRRACYRGRFDRAGLYLGRRFHAGIGYNGNGHCRRPLKLNSRRTGRCSGRRFRNGCSGLFTGNRFF